MFVNSSWVISFSVSSLDTIFSMLFNVLPVNKAILLCFFFSFLIVFKRVLAILLLIENTKLRLALVFPTDAPITVTNEALEMPPFADDKANKILSS